MKKILIMDDNIDFLKRMQENITKFQVLVATTIKDAIGILESNDISFFVVDRDLGGEEDGEIVYDKIFSKGKSIPAMILSGNPISEQTHKELLEMGFSSIQAKGNPRKSDSEVIDEEAMRILNDSTERIKQVKNNVKWFRIGKNKLGYKDSTKSVDDWIKSIENWEYVDDEEELKAAIIDLCMATRGRIDDYRFKQMV